MGEGHLLVGDSAIIGMKSILEDAGGVLKTRTEDQLKERLFEVSNNLWKEGKATKLGDGRWVLDIGKWFGNLAIYAKVIPYGENMVVASILDESELIDAKVDTALASSRGEKKPSVNEAPTVVDERPMWKPPPPGRQKIDQALVRWTDGKDHNIWSQDKVDVGKIPEKVQELVARGVSVHDIEIWTNMKRPRINVELV